jgi:protein gp37
MPGKYWTRAWNPVTGCTPVSPACDHCYAIAAALRIVRMGGAAAQRYAPVVDADPPRWTGIVRRHPELYDQPRAWKQPEVVFAGNMSDLFHPDVPWAGCHRHLFRTMLETPHTYILCTKRPKRMAEMVERAILEFKCEMPDRLWFGTTIERPGVQDKRTRALMSAPVRRRWISFEPFLADGDAFSFRGDAIEPRCTCCGAALDMDPSWRWAGDQWEHKCPDIDPNAGHFDASPQRSISLAIIGDESGPDRRQANPHHAALLIDELTRLSVRTWVKQWSSGGGIAPDPLDKLPWASILRARRPTEARPV